MEAEASAQADAEANPEAGPGPRDNANVEAGADASAEASAESAEDVSEGVTGETAGPGGPANPGTAGAGPSPGSASEAEAVARTPVYYVISDLHIGGDEQLEEVPFLAELLEFLEDVAAEARASDRDVELVINGDAFGLWELTTLEGPEKLDALLETYPELFEQFRETGEYARITMLPGNHDHELAAYDEYRYRFAEYNVELVQDPSVTRPIGEHAIHFEHGHQHDPNNRIEDWGNPYDRPLGYHYNTVVVSRAGRLSDRGRYNWLKDVQAVTPTERVPAWLASKYFYREMNPLLRFSLLPFLLLFNVSVILAILGGLDLAGIWSTPVEAGTAWLGQFGLAGTAIWFFLALNAVIAGLAILLAIPLGLIRRDVRQTISRFGVFETALTVDADRPYEATAEQIFEDEPATAVYCYGHTHRPRLTALEGGLLVNTGTWLKRLHRREGVIGVLPPVYYPSYHLLAARIERTDAGIEVSFEERDKSSPAADEMTLTERLLTLGREPEPETPQPRVYPVAGESGGDE